MARGAVDRLRSDELVIRRVVGSDGRSRAYLNGQAVPVQLLREAGNILIDIHGQHEFQSLTRAPRSASCSMATGGSSKLAGQVGIAHRVWLEMLNRTLELEGKARDRDAKLELLRYQAQELNALQAEARGDRARSREERARLANRGRLAEGAQTALRRSSTRARTAARTPASAARCRRCATVASARCQARAGAADGRGGRASRCARRRVSSSTIARRSTSTPARQDRSRGVWPPSRSSRASTG